MTDNVLYMPFKTFKLISLRFDMADNYSIATENLIMLLFGNHIFASLFAFSSYLILPLLEARVGQSQLALHSTLLYRSILLGPDSLSPGY